MGKVLSHLENWGIGVNYCWNCGPPKFLLHFIEYRLDQLNNKHSAVAVNLTVQFFESHGHKSFISSKSLNYFDPSTTKWWPFEIFAKLNRNHLLIANLFNKYQAFCLMEMHNMSKFWFSNNKFRLWKCYLYD